MTKINNNPTTPPPSSAPENPLAKLSDEELMDMKIDNEGSLEECLQQVKAFVEEIKKREPSEKELLMVETRAVFVISEYFFDKLSDTPSELIDEQGIRLYCDYFLQELASSTLQFFQGTTKEIEPDDGGDIFCVLIPTFDHVEDVQKYAKENFPALWETDLKDKFEGFQKQYSETIELEQNRRKNKD